VNREISFFRSLGRGDRVYLFAIDSGAATDKDLLPEALRTGSMPLFADARRGKDGWSRAVAKTAAAVMQVPLDAIWSRFQREKRRRSTLLAATAAALVTLIVLWQNQIQATNNEREATNNEKVKLEQHIEGSRSNREWQHDIEQFNKQRSSYQPSGERKAPARTRRSS
jgi:hypothetical protein